MLFTQSMYFFHHHFALLAFTHSLIKVNLWNVHTVLDMRAAEKDKNAEQTRSS